MDNTVDKTPAERRRQKVRETILSAAERVFAREGEAGLSIRRLARKIDYSPAAIYKYFQSKDELIDELKESFFSALMENVHEITDTGQPFSQRMRHCVGEYVRLATEKPHHYAAAFSGMSTVEFSHEQGDPDFASTEKGRAFTVLCGMVEEGIANGHFRQDLNAPLAAKSLWASMHGLTMMMLHIPSFPAFRPGVETLSREAFIEFHADQIVRGMEADT
ncbi:MAG: TetR/AcrR family transcriptional regulator [Pseudomonadota bacterium]